MSKLRPIKPDITEVHHAIRTLILFMGDDPNRPGLIDTPDRVARSYAEMFSGYSDDPKIKVFQDAETRCDEMVVSKNIEFFSFCEHHLLPFFGVAHIGYIPKDDRIIGLSKLARILDVYARRLQVQERLTHQVARALEGAIDPLGVGVVIEAKHFCMVCRGARKQNSSMVTSKLTGVFSKGKVRREFLNLCNLPK